MVDLETRKFAIAEAVKRANLSALSRVGRAQEVSITADDIELASESLANQRRLLEVRDERTPSVLEQAGRAAIRALDNGAMPREAKLLEALSGLREAVADVRDQL